MRPQYDLSKLKLVGRGIYAERFRRGTNLPQVEERAEDKQFVDDDLRPEYDFSKMRIVKRGPLRKRTSRPDVDQDQAEGDTDDG